MGDGRQIALAGLPGRWDGAGVHRSHRPDPPRRPRLAATDLEQHRPALTGLCRRMLGSATGAEDAVQETLLRAWRAGHRFEGRAPLGAWLVRIARNVCLDELESTTRRPRVVPLLDAAGVLGPPADAIGDASGSGRPHDLASDPATVVLHRETVRLACAVALQVLPPRQRAALILCVVLRLPASEAAHLLGSSVASVNSSIQRARATLLATDAAPHAVEPALDAEGRVLLTRYVTALTTGDARGLVALALEELAVDPAGDTSLPLAA
jgi:RNA polymerase sigma-70 factor (ECF subfamily)